MKAGLACPYSRDVPGGVQEHIRDLAEALMGLVSVISPAGERVPRPLQRRWAVPSRLPGRSGC